MMAANLEKLAQTLLNRDWSQLTGREQNVLKAIENHSSVARNIDKDLQGKRTFGERVADTVASFGGSWTFIGIFVAVLIFWVILNSFILANRGSEFDPYPYILLNLFLSMLAALQAPVIMMSQNRQAARDRVDAANDYEVNLKSELEIRRLHGKLDELREGKWSELVEMQQQQIRLLEKLLRDQISSKSHGKRV
jgi:uncharacterized membrane protein